MKEVFFTLLALSIPLVVLAGLLYMFGHGVLTVVGDWYERRQLCSCVRKCDSGSRALHPSRRRQRVQARRQRPRVNPQPMPRRKLCRRWTRGPPRLERFRIRWTA